MEFIIYKSAIEPIVINLQHFIEKRDATQIISHILFEVDSTIEDPTVTIKATNMEIGLLYAIKQIEVKEAGSFTVNGRSILNIIKTLKDGDILFTLNGNTVEIKQGRTNFKLPTFDPTEFPKFPSTDKKKNLSIESQSLIKGFKKVASAIDSNNPKYELNGALINILKETIDIVGTDTRRLAIFTINNGYSSDSELSLIVPKKAILEIQKLFFEHIEIYYDENTLIIKDHNRLFFTRLINGRFPPYKKIIPENTKYNISLPTKQMVESIKMVTTVSQEIQITFTPNLLIFNSLSIDNIEAKTELKVESAISELKISFNSRYLLDFLSQVESEEFSIGINGSTLPFIVETEKFITIIMPIIS